MQKKHALLPDIVFENFQTAAALKGGVSLLNRNTCVSLKPAIVEIWHQQDALLLTSVHSKRTLLVHIYIASLKKRSKAVVSDSSKQVWHNNNIFGSKSSCKNWQSKCPTSWYNLLCFLAIFCREPVIINLKYKCEEHKLENVIWLRDDRCYTHKQTHFFEGTTAANYLLQLQ